MKQPHKQVADTLNDLEDRINDLEAEAPEKENER
jgi:hypothetical protein